MNRVVQLQQAARGQFDNLLDDYAQGITETMGAYQELLAGAYAQVCKLDPRDCQIVHQHTVSGTNIFYTNRKPWVVNDVVAAVGAENDALRGRIKDLEDEVKQAWEDGYAEGHEEGYTAGLRAESDWA